jgi:hypothetical protein
MIRLMTLYGFALRIAVGVCFILCPAKFNYMLDDTSSVSVQAKAIHGQIAFVRPSQVHRGHLEGNGLGSQYLAGTRP